MLKHDQAWIKKKNIPEWKNVKKLDEQIENFTYLNPTL